MLRGPLWTENFSPQMIDFVKATTIDISDGKIINSDLVEFFKKWQTHCINNFGNDQESASDRVLPMINQQLK